MAPSRSTRTVVAGVVAAAIIGGGAIAVARRGRHHATTSTTIAAVATTAATVATTTSTVAAGPWTPPAQEATSGCQIRGGDPDPRCTPGALNPAVTQANIATTICKSGWSSQQRAQLLPVAKSSALKVKVAGYYSPPGVPATSEGDHLISIELGGDPAGGPGGSGANFWDEPHALVVGGTDEGSLVKDRFENYLHAQICSGALKLNDAQREIATDWVSAWQSAGRP